MNINEELRYATKIISDLNTCNKTLRANQLKQEQGFNRERKGWDRNLKQLKVDNTNLTSQLTQSQISHAKYKAELATKSKKIRSMESMIKILETELENIKSKLESKVNELECLKSEAISKPVIGGDDEKNMTKSDDISAVIESSHIVTAPSNNSISKYFIRRKSMDQAEKINNIISDHTDDKNTPILEESVIRGYASSQRVDTEIIPKVSDEIDISKANNNILQKIPNMTPYLTQPENHIPSLVESNTQIPIGGIGTIPIMLYGLLY